MKSTMHITASTQEDCQAKVNAQLALGFHVSKPLEFCHRLWRCEVTREIPDEDLPPPRASGRVLRRNRFDNYHGGEVSAGQELIDLGIEMRYEELNEPEW